MSLGNTGFQLFFHYYLWWPNIIITIIIIIIIIIIIHLNSGSGECNHTLRSDATYPYSSNIWWFYNDKILEDWIALATSYNVINTNP